MNKRTITNTADRMFHDALALLHEAGVIDQPSRHKMVEQLAQEKQKSQERYDEAMDLKLKEQGDADLNRPRREIVDRAGERVVW